MDEIVLYSDGEGGTQDEEFALSELVLKFLETPQYLRRRLYGISPSLKFAGILPPLQIPSHNVSSSVREIHDGELREGLVLSSKAGTTLVDVGIGEPVTCLCDLPAGSRLTVKLKKQQGSLHGEVFDKSKINIYWGYRVKTRKSSIGTLLEKERYDLKIGTSHYGSSLIECWSKFSASIRDVESVLIAFGSPKQGLNEMLSSEGKKPEELFDYYVNTVPNQYVSTVRTEEAVMLTLAILNLAKAGN